MKKGGKGRLTIPYVRKHLTPGTYWFASSEQVDDIESVVFYVPKGATDIDVTSKDRTEILVNTNVGVRVFCESSELTRNEPLHLFRTDTLRSITKDQFKMMCYLFEND